MQQLLFTRKG